VEPNLDTNTQYNFAPNPLFIKVVPKGEAEDEDVDFDTFPELSDAETDALISEIYNEDMDVECVFAS